ncbi:hypothetical protein JM946_00900 [Steroidobacter sp. S1-65]|uniref:Uncharacterized protein n=1 Tax=Steroidobacter gossypii TaxID=2805490 RepID=A0ABS1WQL8_9GAMM|nr:hypothetical protein [Steroidobacter gossypii]MBM0103275.1 hypothetical protein [Steroidobacter gossypii]
MDQLAPQLHDLLSTVRALYVLELSEAVRNHPESFVEPALRTADGTLAREGTPPTPYRADLIVKSTGETVQIDSTRRLTFRDAAFDLNRFTVHIGSFFWDCANVRVTGVTALEQDLLTTWFERWFDTEDEREPDQTGLFGVVHSLSDVEVAGDAWMFQIDFGSAPADACTDLIASLESAGASSLEVS